MQSLENASIDKLNAIMKDFVRYDILNTREFSRNINAYSKETGDYIPVSEAYKHQLVEFISKFAVYSFTECLNATAILNENSIPNNTIIPYIILVCQQRRRLKSL